MLSLIWCEPLLFEAANQPGGSAEGTVSVLEISVSLSTDIDEYVVLVQARPYSSLGNITACCRCQGI